MGFFSFLYGVSSAHKGKSIRVTFKNYLNTCNLNFGNFDDYYFWIFSFNVWEWFLYSSVLEQTEFDLSKINWLRGVILLIQVVFVHWNMFPLYHTPIRLILAFQDQISILIMDCVTIWSWGSHQEWCLEQLFKLQVLTRIVARNSHELLLNW